MRIRVSIMAYTILQTEHPFVLVLMPQLTAQFAKAEDNANVLPVQQEQYAWRK
jgi:hypothetical protein